MAYTALQLITRSYYLSQVVSRELQSVGRGQIDDGLYLLNALLGFKSSDVHHIPYFQEYEFSTVIGQEKYVVPNLVQVDSVTYNIGDVRYSLQETTRDQYFSGPRVDGIQSLPYMYRIERTLDGSDVYLYFEPSGVWTAKIWGKFGFTDVTLQTDLSLVYDAFYIEYMRHLLADMICGEYGATFPDAARARLAIYS